ncbi:MAG: hypothetical protein ABIO70_10565 [Pseudomonadota bacterium]
MKRDEMVYLFVRDNGSKRYTVLPIPTLEDENRLIDRVTARQQTH